MSSYLQKLKNPKTGKEQVAYAIDDYYAPHVYGYGFRKDGGDASWDLTNTTPIVEYCDFYKWEELQESDTDNDIIKDTAKGYPEFDEEINMEELQKINEDIENSNKLNQEYQDLQTVKGWLINKMNATQPNIDYDHDVYLWSKQFYNDCNRRQDEIRKLLNK